MKLHCGFFKNYPSVRKYKLKIKVERRKWSRGRRRSIFKKASEVKILAKYRLRTV